MAKGIDDLDFDDLDQQTKDPSIEEQIFGAENNFEKPWSGDPITEKEPVNNPPIASAPADTKEDNIIVDLLKSKGIEDPNQIKFEDEQGNIQSKPWSELTKEEQINILNTPQTTDDTDLDDEETKLINQLRLAGMTPEEFMQKTYQDGLQNGQQSVQTEPSYEIDDISDDDLFAYDLKARSEDLTDDEILQALERAKENPELYAKQISGIRQEYKKLEDDQNKQIQAEQEQQQLEQQQVFQNNIIQSIDQMNSIGSLDVQLDNDDKEELAEFILGTDQAGNNYLGKALNDPETLTRMSWFALRGADALDDIQEYYNNQITQVRQQAYQQGLNDGKTNKNPRVVVQQPAKPSQQLTGLNNNNKEKSIDDLDY